MTCLAKLRPSFEQPGLQKSARINTVSGAWGLESGFDPRLAQRGWPPSGKTAVLVLQARSRSQAGPNLTCAYEAL